MILSRTEIIEKHPNGNISYVETKAIVAPLWIAKYPNHRISEDGTIWIRTGINKKYNADGTLRWELKYNNYGDLVE